MVFKQGADLDSDDLGHNDPISLGGICKPSDASSSFNSSQRQTHQDDLTRTNTGESRKERPRRKSVSLGDDLHQDPGYDADVEVIKPYAIEEPEDDLDTSPQSTWPATPKLLENGPAWQNDIVNSMRNLYCDSDSTDNIPWMKQKRGRKRKSISGPPNCEQDGRERMPGLKGNGVETLRRDDPLVNSRKLRRRSTKSRKDVIRMLDGSASSPFRGEVSGTDLTSGQFESNNASSRMDLD